MRKPSIYLSEQFLYDVWPQFSASFKNPSTKATYFSDINTFTDFIKKDIFDVTREDCINYISYLQEKRYDESNLDDKRSMKSSTISKKYKELSRLFSYIEQNYKTPESFSNHFLQIEVEHPIDSIKEKGIISLEHMDMLLTYFKEYNMSLYISVILAVKQMLRTSELTRLKVNHITIDANESKCLFVRQPNGSSRYVKLSDDVFNILINHMDTLDGEYIISKNGHAPYSNRTLQKYLKDACSMLEIPKFTFNDLRNSGMVNCISNGAEIEEVRKEIGMKTNRHITRLTSLTINYTKSSDYVNFDLKEI